MRVSDAFNDLLMWVCLRDKHRDEKPGDLVSRCSPEMRDALQELKSDDIQVRTDVIRDTVSRCGFCDHGRKYTEQCDRCQRRWSRSEIEERTRPKAKVRHG